MAEDKNNENSKSSEPLFSTLLAECPGLWNVVEVFASTLPTRVMAMQDALRDGSYDQLTSIAQQLQEAGQSHGYKVIADRALDIEQAAGEQAIKGLEGKLAEMTALIVRVRLGLEVNNDKKS